MKKKMMAACDGMRLRGDEMAPGYKYLMSDTYAAGHAVRIEFGATRSYAMNCKQATPSVWGNLTGMCFCSNAEVQSSWDNVKKSKNPLWTIR